MMTGSHSQSGATEASDAGKVNEAGKTVPQDHQSLKSNDKDLPKVTVDMATDASSTQSATGSASTSTGAQTAILARRQLARSGTSYNSVPPEGSLLTGKQEHYLKRELLSQHTKFEIEELASPTALQRFGAPFRSSRGEVKPQESELPVLRYMFVHHVRNFPFLDQAREKEFWQDKLQVFLESFANKHISSSEDRLEETKRKKLALKAQKLLELMMVSGIPTASGYEERIRFSEMEVVERGADEGGLVANAPKSGSINGWEVNVAGVRSKQVRRHVRWREEAEYIIHVRHISVGTVEKKEGENTEEGEAQVEEEDGIYVSRTYDDFKRLHKRIRLELPGKVLAPLPRYNSADQVVAVNPDDHVHYDGGGGSDSESTVSSQNVAPPSQLHLHSSSSPVPMDANAPPRSPEATSAPPPQSSPYGLGNFRGYLNMSGSGHKRSVSSTSQRTPRASIEGPPTRTVVLFRETSRVSLRAALRQLLQNDRIADSAAMREFLTLDPLKKVTQEEMTDIERRQVLDEKRIAEQRRFYEVARQRAAELDVHMEKFRRDIVERNGLTKLFQEIKVKNTIQELAPEYRKFAEWVRIEVAATIYHLFLAEDNSPELFGQAKRIHSLIPYSLVKNVVRFSNPTTVMNGILDIFLLQPFGARSLLQRIFGMAISDGITNIQKSIDILVSKRLGDERIVYAEKIRQYAESPVEVKNELKSESAIENIDLLVCIMRTDHFSPKATDEQTQEVFNAYVAWNNAVENVDSEMRANAELFAHMKQLLKLYMRQRDKAMMLQMIEEPNTLRLFRDLFQIFYEPLVRVYKSANVYNSIMDFSEFVDDVIKTVEAAQRQDFSADPNQTVQAFIDLCARHEHNLYKFIHQVHVHDNGLFTQLMGWLEGILAFLKQGPKGGSLDMNDLIRGALEAKTIDSEKLISEVNALIKWQMARKRWHMNKTRQKMAAEGEDTANGHDGMGISAGAEMLGNAFKSSDFGLNEMDIADMADDDSPIDSDEESGDDMFFGSDEEEDQAKDAEEVIGAERARRRKQAERLRRTAGEPKKPEVVEVGKLTEQFVLQLRRVLAD